MSEYTLPTVACKKCGYKWPPRSQKIKQCPNPTCRTHHWNNGEEVAIPVLPELECTKCGWTWTPRKEDVKQCPHCKSAVRKKGTVNVR